jgi:hypothetical protein
MKDSDCTQGKNGRCVSIMVGQVKCSYDECTADADCGSASVCSCREPNNAFANTCERGNCKTDADCPNNYCSPSGIGIDVYCRMGISLGSFGYFCHGPTDACLNDTDCTAAGMGACIFEPTKSKWVCAAPMCVN